MNRLKTIIELSLNELRDNGDLTQKDVQILTLQLSSCLNNKEASNETIHGKEL